MHTSGPTTILYIIHDLIIHEMLRKKGKATQHNRKTKQHNSPNVHVLYMYIYTHVLYV